MHTVLAKIGYRGAGKSVTSMHNLPNIKMVSVRLMLDKLRHDRFERGADSEPLTGWELFLEGELRRGKTEIMMGYEPMESSNVS